MQLSVCREGNTTKESQWNYLCPKGLSRVQVIGHSYRCCAFQDHRFRSMEETKHMDIELLLQFMVHMEVCREITDSNMLDLLAINYPDYKDDRHFLFPGLITESIEGIQKKCDIGQ